VGEDKPTGGIVVPGSPAPALRPTDIPEVDDLGYRLA